MMLRHAFCGLFHSSPKCLPFLISFVFCIGWGNMVKGMLSMFIKCVVMTILISCMESAVYNCLLSVKGNLTFQGKVK